MSVISESNLVAYPIHEAEEKPSPFPIGSIVVYSTGRRYRVASKLITWRTERGDLLGCYPQVDGKDKGAWKLLIVARMTLG